MVRKREVLPEKGAMRSTAGGREQNLGKLPCLSQAGGQNGAICRGQGLRITILVSLVVLEPGCSHKPLIQRAETTQARHTRVHQCEDVQEKSPMEDELLAPNHRAPKVDKNINKQLIWEAKKKGEIK